MKTKLITTNEELNALLILLIPITYVIGSEVLLGLFIFWMAKRLK